MTTYLVTQATDDGLGTTVGTLSYAIAQANLNAGADTIDFNTNVRLTAANTQNINSDITIIGDSFTVSGDANNSSTNDNGDVRPFYIQSGTVTITNLTISNGRAVGSSGGSGGAGFGGGLFIYSGNVSLTGVTLSNNQAIGGNGSSNGNGSTGGTGAYNGNTYTGGGGGGGTGTGSGGGGGGGGGFNGGFGGYGGYGGFGLGGGGGGGGGGGLYGGNGGNGGFGGFGGGGGGGGGGGSNFGLGGYGGYGGYGGGNGGLGGNGGGTLNLVSGGYFTGGSGGAGGGGAGFGGGIFIRSGSLTLTNSTLTSNSATGGLGGSGAGNGSGLGGAIFAMKSTTNSNGNNAGMPSSLPTVILDTVSFSGNNAANDTNTGTITSPIAAGTNFNNNDLFGNGFSPPVVVNQAPTAVSAPNKTLAENTDTTNRVKVADITVTDDGIGTNTLSLSGTDASSFEIIGTELYVKAGTSLNYEAQSSYAVTVNVDDTTVGSTPDASTSFTLSLSDVDEFDVTTPIDNNATANSVAENATNGSLVGITAFASDADGTTNTVTYSLTNNAGGRFSIDTTTGVVSVADGTLLNYENATSHNITVKATSADSSTSTQTFTVAVTNVNEAPTNLTLSANTITENTIIGTGFKIGDITITDPDATGNNNVLTVDDTTNFAIRNTNQLFFVGSSPDFETKSSYSINLTSTDGALTYSKAFTVNVNNINEVGTDGNDIVIGGSGNDSLYGLGGNDILYGLGGNDTLIGGAGTNTANYSYATSGVNVNLTTGIAQDGQGGTDTLIQIQNVTGSNFNDLLTGDSNANTLNGRDGNDTINGLAGNDILIGEKGNNVLNGGDGVDTAEYKAAPNGVVVNLLTGQATTNGYGGADTLSNIETVSGSDNGNDKITGDNLANSLLGNGGNDTLIGLGGNDQLNGGIGADSLVGGTGDDSYSVDNAGDVIVENANEGNDLVLSTVSYVLGDNVETLSLKGTALNGTGNALDNSIIGNASNNLLNGGAGNDRMDGDAGNDTLTGGSGRDDLTGGLGSDRFDFRTLGDSLLTNTPDIIRDFNATEDKFWVSKVPTVFTQGGTVTALTQSGISTNLTTSNFANLGDAAQFKFGTRTFVAINDSTAGFQSATDAVIELTTSGLVGTLTTSNFVI